MFKSLANWQDVEKFKAEHKSCHIAVITNTQDSVDAALVCYDHNVLIDTYIAYPTSLCVNPSVCVGRSSCPRDYACSE